MINRITNLGNQILHVSQTHIDPRFIRVACTLRKCQNAQNPSVVSEPRLVCLILVAICLKKSKSCCLTDGLAESMGGLAESTCIFNLLAEQVHALDEQGRQSAVFRLQLLEMDQKHYPKLFWYLKTCFRRCNVFSNSFTTTSYQNYKD